MGDKVGQVAPIDIADLFVRMESEAGLCGRHVDSVGEGALVSIAVSLKRIADTLCGPAHAVDRAAIAADLSAGMSLRAAARKYGVGVGVVRGSRTQQVQP